MTLVIKVYYIQVHQIGIEPLVPDKITHIKENSDSRSFKISIENKHRWATIKSEVLWIIFFKFPQTEPSKYSNENIYIFAVC